MKNLGSVIASKRKEKGYSQIGLSRELEKYQITVTNAAISAWEKNKSMPTAAQFLVLCKILGITDIYDSFIGENPASPFAGLNTEGIEKAREYIELLKESKQYRKKADIIPLAPRRMKVSLLSTSAGTGEYMDDENFEELDVYEPVPEKAEFGVHLNGDSMEPEFKDQELVWFRSVKELQSGEFGLVYLNGMTYFKKYVVNSKGAFLVSLNVKYAPVPIRETDDFKIFARLAD